MSTRKSDRNVSKRNYKADQQGVDKFPFYCICCNRGFLNTGGFNKHKASKDHAIQLEKITGVNPKDVFKTQEYHFDSPVPEAIPEKFMIEDSTESDFEDMDDISSDNDSPEAVGLNLLDSAPQTNQPDTEDVFMSDEIDGIEDYDAILRELDEIYEDEDDLMTDLYPENSYEYIKEKKHVPLKQCDIELQSDKTREFCELILKNNLTEKAKKDLIEFMASFSNDSIPKSLHFLEMAMDFHFPQLPVYEKKIDDKSIHIHLIKDLLEIILKNQNNFDPLVWNSNQNCQKKSHESNFRLWSLLDEVKKQEKTLYVKLFVDEYLTRRRRKTKSHALYLSLANFSQRDQKSIETKFVVCILPPLKKRSVLYKMLDAAFVSEMQKLMETGIQIGEETYGVLAYSILGDHVGQCLLAGLTGSVFSEMPNRFCKSKLNDLVCKNRNSTEMHQLILKASYLIENRHLRKVTKGKDLLKAESITYPISPLWKILKIDFLKQFGICWMHLMYEGIGSLLLLSYANTKGEEFVKQIESRLKKYNDKNRNSNLKKVNKIYFETTNRITKKKEFRLALSTAEEIQIAMILAPSLMFDLLDNTEWKLLKVYLKIDEIGNRNELTDEDIDQLEKYCIQFRKLFTQHYIENDTVSTKRPNLDTLVHLAEMFFFKRFQGLPYSQNTKYYEVVHLPMKMINSNHKNMLKSIIQKYERKRSHKIQREPPILGFKLSSHLANCKCEDSHSWKKIHFSNFKIQTGEFIKIFYKGEFFFGEVSHFEYLAHTYLKIVYKDYEPNGKEPYTGLQMLKFNGGHDLVIEAGHAVIISSIIVTLTNNKWILNPFFKKEVTFTFA